MLWKRKKNKKATITLFIVFFITAIIIVMISAVLAPMGVLFNTESYLAGQDILRRANASIQDIDDPTIKASVLASTNSALAAGENNINVNNNIFQYGWVFMIVLLGLVIFLFTRQLTELRQGGGGFI